ncbi:MAG: RIP metalloprotease [Methylocystis sp.]|nr:RIP metalloprotease [Methylocystis sp.]MBI3274714.1 RIP metalloprotease [Methylocystis sp.]
MNIATYSLPFLFVLTVVVFFHELGHFLVARWCGVKVDVFSLGFGPELYAFNDRKGTRWRLAAVPLGGYVKFHGDPSGAGAPDPSCIETLPPEERAITFFAQPVAKRAAIVIAGPLANFILATAIYSALFFSYGRVVLTPRVAAVIPGGIAEAAGFQRGDLVLTINGAPIESFGKMQEIVSGASGKPLTIVVRRGDQEVTLGATPQLREIETSLGKTKVGMLGLQASDDPADMREERYGLVNSVRLAFSETWMVVDRTFSYLGGLLAGREAADQLSGPIGIAQVSGQMAKAIAKVGVWPLFNLIAIISTSIGLLNLMPVPMLDGGYLLFYGIEAVRGRALTERTQEYAFRVGLAMVCSLMVFSTYNDIARLIHKIAGGGS